MHGLWTFLGIFRKQVDALSQRTHCLPEDSTPQKVCTAWHGSMACSLLWLANSRQPEGTSESSFTAKISIFIRTAKRGDKRFFWRTFQAAFNIHTVKGGGSHCDNFISNFEKEGHHSINELVC